MKTQKPDPQFEQITIELKNKIVVLNILPFDTDVDVTQILKIQHEHLWAEIISFNVVFNRIANLKAEQENIVSHSKFDLEIFESQLYDEYKKKLVDAGEKATEKALEMAILRDARFSIKKKLHFDKVKNLGYLDSLYWSAMNKAGLLKVLSDKLKPEEFSNEILTDTINGVMIKASKKLIA